MYVVPLLVLLHQITYSWQLKLSALVAAIVINKHKVVNTLHNSTITMLINHFASFKANSETFSHHMESMHELNDWLNYKIQK